ncbi:hypothetical protein [Clostridium coskatii]|uniref:Uncharacterized protein n=1 Tax=Clostridium coskatii TaxID=1705578 RepID=A0A162J5S8_9CLOT|nr:hypothetical protein [Clostridium coskatii]OAA90705.1 hypothetical protein WX73_02070 [Clostridium coskatii]OBR97459.1 hypothetical protein CLCOS_03150 [Clostridium coskatii]
MLLTRYGPSVLDLDIYYGLELIKKVYEEKTNSMVWDMWLAKYPWMDKDNFISFEDFKKQMLGDPEKPKTKPKTKEEIYKQADDILKAFNKSKGGTSHGDI